MTDISASVPQLPAAGSGLTGDVGLYTWFFTGLAAAGYHCDVASHSIDDYPQRGANITRARLKQHCRTKGKQSGLLI